MVRCTLTYGIYSDTLCCDKLLMKRGARIVCLLLSVLLLVGCAPMGANNDSNAAPGLVCSLLAVIPLTITILPGRAGQGLTSAHTGRLVAIASAIVQP